MAAGYDDETVERALTALAICGTSKAAAAHLKAAGGLDRIPDHHVILRWRREDPERWERIATQRARLVDEHCIDEFRTVVVEGVAASRLAIAKALEQLEDGKARYPDVSALNLAKTTAIYAEKLANLLGKPTHIVEHRSTADVLAALERDGLLSWAGAVDGEATDMPDIPDVPGVLPPGIASPAPDHDEGRSPNGDRPDVAVPGGG